MLADKTTRLFANKPLRLAFIIHNAAAGANKKMNERREIMPWKKQRRSPVAESGLLVTVGRPCIQSVPNPSRVTAANKTGN